MSSKTKYEIGEIYYKHKLNEQHTLNEIELGEGIALRYGEGMRARTEVMCMKPRRGKKGMKGMERIGQYFLE